CMQPAAVSGTVARSGESNSRPGVVRKDFCQTPLRLSLSSRTRFPRPICVTSVRATADAR
ncbi:MAG: hypothetical protein ACK55I_21140, partial [bacterium]